jgi:hypothetical protein
MGINKLVRVVVEVVSPAAAAAAAADLWCREEEEVYELRMSQFTAHEEQQPPQVCNKK